MLTSRNLSGIILIIILALQSCTKDTDLRSVHSKPDLSIDEAREFYNASTSKSKLLMTTEKTGSTQNKKNTVEPIWKFADTTNDKMWHIVEVPVDESISTASITNSISEDKLVPLTPTPNGVCKLVVVKNKVTGKMESALMRITSYTQEAVNNLSKNTYKHKDPSFTGSIIFTTINNIFINGWEFVNGIPSREIQIKHVFYDPNAKMSMVKAKTNANISQASTSRRVINALSTTRPNPMENDDLYPGEYAGGCGKVTDYYQKSCCNPS